MAKGNPKELEPLDDDDEQEASEAQEGGEEEGARAHGEDAEIDVDKPSRSDDAGDKAERRRQRYTELQAQSTAAEERARAAEERLARLEGEFSGFRNMSQSQNRQEPHDDTEDRIKRLMDQRATKLQLIRSAVGNEEATNALARESMDLEAQISDIRIERMIKKHAGDNRQPDVNVEQRMLMAETPQIYNDNRLRSYAQGIFMTMVAEGKPGNIQTAREANIATLKKFGLVRGAPPAPAESQRRAMGGMSSGSTAPAPSGKVKLSKSLRKIAAARSAIMSPNDDETAAQVKFAKRLRKKGIA